MEVSSTPTKDSLRKRIWDLLKEKDIARFPLPPHGRIPNFKGAQHAARNLTRSNEWTDAKIIKINPDSPQQPVRQAALNEGKTLYMAVPRLRDKKCFIELNPKKLKAGFREATTIRGAFKRGRQLEPSEMREVDLVVAGSVAVNYNGGRVGKGGGYSDLEYAIAREFEIINDKTPIASTVHELQVLEQDIPGEVHDISLDIIATPKSLKLTETKLPRSSGIIWKLLSEDQIKAIPILKALKQGSGDRG
ncbi:MAG: 5-formyltetrahydrofolate cyclo-ligase [Thermoplasmata archaeon]|nr:MAG: 5-formyltetrahydrofolate cyclo-ligase [Thermoplasmata archaeon]